MRRTASQSTTRALRKSARRDRRHRQDRQGDRQARRFPRNRPERHRAGPAVSGEPRLQQGQANTLCLEPDAVSALCWRQSGDRTRPIRCRSRDTRCRRCRRRSHRSPIASTSGNDEAARKTGPPRGAPLSSKSGVVLIQHDGFEKRAGSLYNGLPQKEDRCHE